MRAIIFFLTIVYFLYGLLFHAMLWKLTYYHADLVALRKTSIAVLLFENEYISHHWSYLCLHRVCIFVCHYSMHLSLRTYGVWQSRPIRKPKLDINNSRLILQGTLYVTCRDQCLFFPEREKDLRASKLRIGNPEISCSAYIIRARSTLTINISFTRSL